MPIQPRPMAETARPQRPSLRVFMMATPEKKLEGCTLIDASPLQRIPVWGGHSYAPPLTWTLAKNQNNSCKIKTKSADKSVLSTRLLAGQLHGLTETLSGIAHNHSHDAARKHDFKIIMLARWV